MAKLSLMDQMFCSWDAAGLPPLNMAGAMILDPSTSQHPLDAPTLADHLAARLEKIPILRKKVIQDALKIGNMYRVDDPDFNVNNHVICTSLKSPGGYDEFTDYLGKIAEHTLDPSKPLWRFEVIEGLAGGHIGVTMLIHHALMDGTGAVRMLEAILDPSPVPPEKPKKRAWKVERQPSQVSLLRNALLDGTSRFYVKRPSLALKIAKPMLKKVLKRLSPEADRLQEEKLEVHRTSLNSDKISAKRCFSYTEFPLAEVKAIGRHYDATVNDVSLLLCSCALQHYFESIGEEIDFDLVVMMALSLRSQGDNSEGNAVAVRSVSLHNSISDLEERLRAIISDTNAIKRRMRDKGGDTPPVEMAEVLEIFNPLVLDGLMYILAKTALLNRKAFVNASVTNVPGPREPVYLAGARQIASAPMGPAVDAFGLTVTFTSTDSNLFAGFLGSAETVKDKELFVNGAQGAFERLNAMVKHEAQPKKVTPKRARHKTSTNKDMARQIKIGKPTAKSSRLMT